MDFEEAGGARLRMALATIRTDIDEAFDRLLPLPDDTRAPLVEAMRYAAIGGGKRIRPLLLVATATMFNVSREAAILAGAAVESIHVYSLIHDDLPCMDDDEMRHGKPTLHKAFDEATAVLAGDSLHALAFDILTQPDTSTDPFVRAELVATLARASGHDGMAGGQMMDIVSEEQSYDLRQVTRLQQLKTGALIAFACEVRRAERDESRLYLVAPARPDELPDGVHYSAIYPAQPLFAAAHRVFSACGFNLMREMRPHRHKHRFLPFARSLDDQYARARLARQELGG